MCTTDTIRRSSSRISTGPVSAPAYCPASETRHPSTRLRLETSALGLIKFTIPTAPQLVRQELQVALRSRATAQGIRLRQIQMVLKVAEHPAISFRPKCSARRLPESRPSWSIQIGLGLTITLRATRRGIRHGC